jgi:putative endopeptidase
MKKYLLSLSILGIVLSACNNKTAQRTSKAEKAQLGYNKEHMDPTVSPCEDFYRYAAGAWMDANPIPGTESRWSMFNVLGKQNDLKLKAILEEKTSKPLLPGTPLQQTQDLYRSAMDLSSIESSGIQSLIAQQKKVQQATNIKELLSLLGSFRANGMASLFGAYVSIDAKKSNTHILYFGQGGLGLPDRDYYLKTDEASEQIKVAYKNYISQLLGLCNLNETQTKAEAIFAIEKNLAEISMSRIEQRDPEKTYNKLSYATFKQQYPYFDWDSYLLTLNGNDKNLILGDVIVSNPTFFEKLNNLLTAHSLSAWKAYFEWQLANGMAAYLTTDFESAHFGFYQTTLRGTNEMKPRWEKAVGIVNAYLGEPLGRLFVERHFSPESKQKVSEMVEDLREAFGRRIEALEWMSPETKAKAKEKLQAFGYKIGYPDEWKDYSSIQIKANNLLANLHAINRFQSKQMMEKLNKPVDKNEWGMSPQTVNAYYSPTRNEIVFPAGILQAPFYDPKADDALNYGGIGAVIGHEFSHGFDDKGSKYDATGNLSNWWTEEDNKRFRERTGKIVAQFNRFEVLDGVFIKGELTQGENIADLAGLTMAYYALQKRKSLDPNAHKPGSDGFTWQQRFFLGWALVWAQNITEKELRNRIITDPHSPGRYRVVGPLSNMPEFHEAFSCSQLGTMHAKEEDRVIIW